MSHPHVVVVGNGMVGQRFVDDLLAKNAARANTALANNVDAETTWRITIIGEEPIPAYDRVALSSYFDGATVDDLVLTPTAELLAHGVDLRLGVTVTSIDRDTTCVELSDGSSLDYDHLVLATGSDPFVPPIDGHDLPGCFVYRTIADLDAISGWASQPHVTQGVEVRDRFVEAFSAHAATPAGRVTLVGAGPGSADLVTVRGAQALAAADVVVYDRLADPDLLALAPAAAERIPMGKAKGSGATQDEINSLLAARAREGNHVVRLKGGDPFVFGRGSEEVAHLAAAGVEVQVVPGVSSALAAPALAGVALTDRLAAGSFTVVSGHRADGDEFRIAAAASPDATLVVLMAATTADAVAGALITSGWAPDAGVCFIHAAATPRQETMTVELSEVEESGCPFAAPTVMVIGPTVQASSASRAQPEALTELHLTGPQAMPA